MTKEETAQEILDSTPAFLSEEQKEAQIEDTDVAVDREVKREIDEILNKD